MQFQRDNSGHAKDAGANDIITIPNALSVLRIVLGLSFPWFPTAWRLPVIMIAALTDLLDGATGRLFGVCSRTGRVLDPVADKVFVAGALATFLYEGSLSIAEILLLGARDLVVIAGTFVGVAMRRWSAFERMTPSLLAKATTVTQFAFFLVISADVVYRELFLILAACLSIAAGGQYLLRYLRDYLRE